MDMHPPETTQAKDRATLIKEWEDTLEGKKPVEIAGELLANPNVLQLNYYSSGENLSKSSWEPRPQKVVDREIIISGKYDPSPSFSVDVLKIGLEHMHVTEPTAFSATSLVMIPYASFNTRTGQTEERLLFFSGQQVEDLKKVIEESELPK